MNTFAWKSVPSHVLLKAALNSPLVMFQCLLPPKTCWIWTLTIIQIPTIYPLLWSSTLKHLDFFHEFKSDHYLL
jgi:hypothetical protein